MLEMVLANVLDSKVINRKVEPNRVGLMFP
jgi:hypothetical protein